MSEDDSRLVLFSSSKGLLNEDSPVVAPLFEDEDDFCCTPNSSANDKIITHTISDCLEIPVQV